MIKSSDYITEAPADKRTGVNSRAGGGQRRETTDPGSNQSRHRRRSRPVRETGMFTWLKVVF